VNRKCFLGTQFCNFQPLHRPYPLKACFHYGCALRCVARDIETPVVFLILSRHATQRAAVMEISLKSTQRFFLGIMLNFYIPIVVCFCLLQNRLNSLIQHGDGHAHYHRHNSGAGTTVSVACSLRTTSGFVTSSVT